ASRETAAATAPSRTRSGLAASSTACAGTGTGVAAGNGCPDGKSVAQHALRAREPTYPDGFASHTCSEQPGGGARALAPVVMRRTPQRDDCLPGRRTVIALRTDLKLGPGRCADAEPREQARRDGGARRGLCSPGLPGAGGSWSNATCSL